MFSRDNDQELLGKNNRVDDGATQVESARNQKAMETDLNWLTRQGMQEWFTN